MEQTKEPESKEPIDGQTSEQLSESESKDNATGEEQKDPHPDVPHDWTTGVLPDQSKVRICKLCGKTEKVNIG